MRNSFTLNADVLDDIRIKLALFDWFRPTEKNRVDV